MEEKNKNGNRKDFKLPDEVKSFIKIDFKRFKKKEGDYYDSKKQLKKAYFAQLVDLLPQVLAVLVKNGNAPSVRENRNAIYKKICDVDFLKYLRKEIKKGCEFDNLILLPTVCYDIVMEAKRQEAARNADNPDQEVTFDVSDVVGLADDILKKKVKKLKKDGIDETVAFDILCVIPTPKILQRSQQYHIRRFFTVLYEHAKTKEINFAKIVKHVFKDEDYIPSVITFALLERKEKIGNFTETQKKLFNDITEYCFTTLEEFKKDDIYAVLKAYVDIRRRDENQGKDTNRRYYISSLPESDYPKILKTVTRLCDLNELNKKYF